MKYFGLVILVLFSACAATKSYVAKRYYQVYRTAAVSPVKEDNGHFVFENDTVRVDYVFWEERGILAYKVANKLGVPIYIDWSRSAFIKNDEKFDYWIDEEKTKAVAYYQGYDVSASFWHNVYSNFQNGHTVNYGIPYVLGLSESETLSASTTTKPERIAFIPPHSFIVPSGRTFHLFSVSGTKLRTDREYIEVTVYNEDNKPVKVKRYYAEYSPNESILKFRNFLMMSTKKDFSTEFYIDNAFYVSNIYEMEAAAFLESLRKPNNFYLRLPDEISIERRLISEGK